MEYRIANNIDYIAFSNGEEDGVLLVKEGKELWEAFSAAAPLTGLDLLLSHGDVHALGGNVSIPDEDYSEMVDKLPYNGALVANGRYMGLDNVFSLFVVYDQQDITSSIPVIESAELHILPSSRKRVLVVKVVE